MQNADNIKETFTDIELLLTSHKIHNEFRKSEQFTDLILKTHDGREFPVHRNIIASGCPYFRAMFNVNSNWPELNQNIVELREEVTTECLELILEYLYTGQIDITSENAFTIHEGAVHFQLNNLKKSVTKFPIRNINMTTVLDLWRYGVKFFNTDLQDKCIEFISVNPDDFFKDFITKLNADELIKISTDLRLKLTQEKLYQYLISWIKIDFAARQKHLKDFMNKIRFNEITTDFKLNNILSDKILYENKEFSDLIVDQYRKSLKPNTSVEETIPKLLVITSFYIYRIHLENGFLCPVLQNSSRMKKISTFGNDRKLLLNLTNEDGCTQEFGVYCPKSNKIKSFPSYKLEFMSSAVSLNDCIYVADPKLLKIFDINAVAWFRGNDGLGEQGLLQLVVGEDNCIYALNDYSIRVNNFPATVKNAIYKFDQRENKWITILDNPVDKNCVFVRPISYKNKIYCFYLNGGKIFDINQQDYVGNISKAPVEWQYFKVTKLNDDCYIFGRTKSSDIQSKIDGWKYNFESDKWTHLNITFPLNFAEPFEEFDLTTMNVPLNFDDNKLFDFDI